MPLVGPPVPRYERRIMLENRLIATLEHHQGSAYGEPMVEFRVFFNPDLSRGEREIIIANYLNELLKGND